MPYELLVIGDASIDQYMLIDTPDSFIDPKTNQKEICFIHGTKIPVKNFRATIAGNVTHVGLGAQKLGIQTAIYTELGDDDNANKVIEAFKKEGIDTKLCKKNKNTNTNVHTIISSEGERTIFSYHKPRDYKLDFETLPKPKWIFYTSLADGFEPFQAKLVEYLKANPEIALAFNPGTLQIRKGVDNLKNILQTTNVLFVNRQEAKILSDSTDKCSQGDIHKKLQKLGPKLTVVTDGAKGSSAHDGKNLFELTAPTLDFDIIDKTGAGDAYSAAFLAALHYKRPLREAMKWGNINSANTLRFVGGIKGLQTKEEIKAGLMV